MSPCIKPYGSTGQPLLTQDVALTDGVTETRHYRPSNLHAWKLYGLSWWPRAIPGKLLTWCQGPSVIHLCQCMNLTGRDLCPSIGWNIGICFMYEAIISAPIWCTCSETDFSHRRLFHIARLWLLCYVIGFTIQQPTRTSSYSSELFSWNVRCNAESCPSGTFIFFLALLRPPFASECDVQGESFDDVIPLTWWTMKTVFLLALASRAIPGKLEIHSGACELRSLWRFRVERLITGRRSPVFFGTRNSRL